MDTGHRHDPSVSPPPVEGTGQKRGNSSLSDQFEPENPFEKVSVKEADENVRSAKRAKPLAASKNGQNRQTFLSFDRIEDTGEAANAPQRASQNAETMEAPQRAGKRDKTMEAPGRAGKKEETKPKASQRAGKRNESKPKAPERAG
ncbi:hypothetical protein ACN38_g11293, partial [Penicillium nordicum]